MNDGWNTSELSEVMHILEKLQEIKYELDNCRKGAYSHCYSYAELEMYLRDLAERLSQNAEGIGYLDRYDDAEEN